MLNISGFSSRHSVPGAAVTEMKSLPKNTPVTSPVEKIAAASGEASASSGVAKSRTPASITRRPGRNFRVEGLGVVSVWISMERMWAEERRRSRAGRARLSVSRRPKRKPEHRAVPLVLDLDPAVVRKLLGEEPLLKHRARHPHRPAQSGDVVGAAFADHVGGLIAVARHVEIIARHLS